MDVRSRLRNDSKELPFFGGCDRFPYRERGFVEDDKSMARRTDQAEVPKSTDLEGWRLAIKEGRLKEIRPEDIAAAFQDLGFQDTQVQNDLAKHLSDIITGILRPRVSYSWPDQGLDIIMNAHAAIFKGLLDLGTADGRALRKAFGSRVLYRLKDAIIKEKRERYVSTDVDEEAVDAVDCAQAERAESEQKLKDPDETITVQEILDRVPDCRKRLAFHWYNVGKSGR
jgi:hypothetical protein